MGWLAAGGGADEVDEETVNAAVGGEFGVKRGGEKVALTDEHRRTLAAGKYLNTGAGADDFWGTNEYHFERSAGKGGLSGEDCGINLAAIGVALNGRIQQAKRALRRVDDLASEQDCSRAGAEGGMGSAKGPQGFKEVLFFKEAEDGGGFAAGQNYAVETDKLVRLTHFHGLRA